MTQLSRSKRHLSFQQLFEPSQLIQFKFPAGQVALISAFPFYSLHIISGLSSLRRHFQIWGENWNCSAAVGAAKPGAGQDSLIRIQNCHRWELWEVGRILPPGRMWKCLPPFFFSLFLWCLKKCASSGSWPMGWLLCLRKSVKYFHTKWRTSDISRICPLRAC